MSDQLYESYDDWYDNGPGSENFKRKILQGNAEFMKKNINFPLSIGQKRIRHKKNGKNILEMANALDRIMRSSPTKYGEKEFVDGIPQNLMKEFIKSSRRLLRYVEELEK